MIVMRKRRMMKTMESLRKQRNRKRVVYSLVGAVTEQQRRLLFLLLIKFINFTRNIKSLLLVLLILIKFLFYQVIIQVQEVGIPFLVCVCQSLKIWRRILRQLTLMNQVLVMNISSH
ncbi:Transient receptor potential cation channel subfamily M member 5 [Bienertia sinuspersici]